MSAGVIEELRAGFEEPFFALGRDSPHDRATVVASWPSVPVELVRAISLQPVFARGHRSPTPSADRVLEPDLFPNRLRQLVEAALTGRLSEVTAVLLPRSSDPDYKCFLYLRELARRGIATALPPVLLYDLLHSDDDDARAYNADRTHALADELARLTGRHVALGDLHTAIASTNRARAAARRLQAQRTGTPRIAGIDAMPLLGAFWSLEPAHYATLVDAATDSLSREESLSGPRVLTAGAPVDGTTLHASIESTGAVVVAELSPFGSYGVNTDVEIADDPYAALANHYGRESIDARLPVDALMDRLDHQLPNVDAVVISLPPDDASFGWDYPRVRDLLATRRVPHTVLTGDPALGTTAADSERLRSLLGNALSRPEAFCG